MGGNTVSQGGPLFSRQFSKPWREAIRLLDYGIGRWIRYLMELWMEGGIVFVGCAACPRWR